MSSSHHDDDRHQRHLDGVWHLCHTVIDALPRGTMAMARTGAFWDRHEARMTDPEQARAFAAELARIRTVDTVVNALDEQRTAVGLSKAALARAIGSDASVVRRLLTATTSNPTLTTVAEVAAALGLKVELVPMNETEKVEMTHPMLGTSATATSGAA
ncbi:helix-turn-helix domain-containing protein [Promicromonospora sp. NPDC057138]|uniref:helix-turn-helix domain-containing protein n=1 Tax=Promicromonospora sp. NPDC057138 TaxID=3346031 RepID=UPI00362B4AD9